MNICVKCKKEMTCQKNGVVAVWHGTHCYRGDTYSCKSCGTTILSIDAKPYHDPDALEIEEAYLINMDKE